MSATKDPNGREPDKKSKSKAQRYTVQPKDMGTGEMHTLRELAIEFGHRVQLKIHEVKKHQVWEIYADEDSLAKYIEYRLNQQRVGQSHLQYSYDALMTEVGGYPDGLRYVELALLKPMKWDQKTGREPDKKP